MSQISKEEFKQLITEYKVGFLSIKNKNGEVVELTKNISIYFNDKDFNDAKNGQTIEHGYTVNCNNQTINFEDFEKLYEFLEFDNLDKINLVNINYSFNNIQDFLDDKEFNDLDMQGILDKYEDADSFELVCPFIKDFCDKYELNFTYNDVENAFDELEKTQKERLRGLYETQCKGLKMFSEKSFETVYNEVKEDALNMIERAEKKGELFFACDNVYKRKTKYYKPEGFFWHAYHDFQWVYDCKKDIEKFKTNPIEQPCFMKCDLSDFEILKPHLISKTLSYSCHCTTTSALYNS